MPTSGSIKYRAACDHCSTTKIKCSQERPQCARCRALGRACHYSRSLRAGKPPRSSQGLNRKLPNAPVVPRHNAIAEHAPLTHTDYAGYPYHYCSPISPGTQQDPAWAAHSTPYPTPPGHGHSEIPYVPDYTMSDSNSPLDPEWLFDFNKGAHFLSDTRASSLDPSMNGTTQHSSPESDAHPTPPDSSHSCAKIATETLNKLYEIPAIHIDPSTTQTTVDQVLSTTSRAVQTCHGLISCQCPKDFHLPILIATILSKVLAWYQAVAWIQDPQTESPDGKGYSKEVVVDDHLAFATYRLDDHMGWTLKNHIVHAHLLKLNDAVCLYHDTFASGSQGDGRHMHGTMGGFLKTRLHFTLGELDRRLSPGSG